MVAAFVPTVVLGAQAPNSRVNTQKANHQSNETNTVTAASGTIRRSAVTQNTRSTSQRTSASSSRSAVTRNVRSDSNASRSATGQRAPVARAATNTTSRNVAAGVSRSAKQQARATAVFSDVSKIGGGYAACRDSYATCMDQFCAVANDTYRRCFCSDKFVDFRNLSDSLDQAVSMLADFQNNNLEAVDKSAAEVSAMYSASEGESAIKRDTSASQKLLNNINDLLTGKKKTYKSSTSTSTSTGVMDLSGLFSSVQSDDDVWGGSSSVFSGDSIFNNGSNYENMSDMEGAQLYAAANRQCSAISHDECGSDAVFNLARSAYSIMITQDCNIYERNINAKKETVKETIRTAEKYLRDARLEEYREHNSASVNECLDKVDAAMRNASACGPNYEACMDPTGRYINATTGEAIYSPALFDLNNLIILDGSADVVGANPDFNKVLENKKWMIESELDTCRDIADLVWAEYKRAAIIKIAQAQDAKIQEVKDSCVETIRECYDEQTGYLDQIGGDGVAKMTVAISAIGAHALCKDSVLACAALYGNPQSCVYDDATKTLTDKDGNCGLKALLAYVNVVDSVRIAQGCEASLREYAQELCAPADNDIITEYPWGCRLRSEKEIQSALEEHARIFCGADLITYSNNDDDDDGDDDKKGDDKLKEDKKKLQVKAARLNNKKTVVGRAATKTTTGAGTISADNYGDIDTDVIESLVDTGSAVRSVLGDIRANLTAQLSSICYDITDEGMLVWESSSDGVVNKGETVSLSAGWMYNVFTSSADFDSLAKYGFSGYKAKVEKTGSEYTFSGKGSFGWGVCMKPTEKQSCYIQQGLPNMSSSDAEWKPTNNQCYLHTSWYSKRCVEIGGYWDNSQCYIK